MVKQGECVGRYGTGVPPLAALPVRLPAPARVRAPYGACSALDCSRFFPVLSLRLPRRLDRARAHPSTAAAAAPPTRTRSIT
jgi:hypothetical protein